MKRWILPLFLSLFFIIMVCFPKTVFAGAAQGLLLWFETVLPTLFPFMVVTGLMINTNTITWITKLLAPVISPFFHISTHGTFVVLCGFLCGYPMGAKIASDLTSSGYISRQEGEYLLSFCNNTSPMFVIGFLFSQNLQRLDLAFVSLLIIDLCAVLCGRFFRRFYHFHPETSSIYTASKEKPISFPAILDDCIINSCENITKIGGYIVVFSILSSLLKLLPASGGIWENILLPSIEITGGIQMLCTQTLPFNIRYVLLMVLSSFGGLCAVFQTQCMVQKQAFSLKRYIIEKLVTAAATSLIAYTYTMFYFH